MNTTAIAPVVALIFLITLYWYWVFELIDHLLKKSRLHKRIRLPVGLINVIFIFTLSAVIWCSMIPYLLLIVVSFVEFHIFYEDTILRKLFCTCACVIHVLAIRSITTGVFSLVSGVSIHNITADPTLYAYSVMATFAFLNIAILFVMKFLPLAEVRIVNQHRDQQVFLVVWMASNIIYLLFNSAVAESKTVGFGMMINQIVAPFSIMLGTYIMLLFAIKTGRLLGYKEKNAQLELTVSKEQDYRSSITKDALLTYEFNLNQDLMVSGFESVRHELGDIIYSYSDMLSYMARKFIHPEDIEDFAKYASPSNITREFEHGRSEIAVEYRRLVSEEKYIWCRAVTNLTKDAESGDIRGFTYVKNIDKEKRQQLELHYKAERDSLTGLYNKGVTEKLITEHLLFNHTRSTSAVFMIDVDNFKEINDNLGHAFGDSVLCELSKKLLHLFRNDDIVGRIGGDEYIAYMKNGATDKILREKGEEICKAFRMSFKSSNEQEYALSSSVGIAVSPRDSITFNRLYECADIALYVAKSMGKNNCQIYDGGNFSGYRSSRS